MNYEIQFAKVTCSGKLTDRFLSSQHSKSQDLMKASMGELFSLVEILSPWYNSAQIGQMIISKFSNAYFEDGSTSDLVNFEMALKKVNESLAQITQNGETEWIGNLNGILATIVGDSLILSPAGKIEAYLLRSGKINHLTYGLTNKVEIHPLKTFSNVISGQLKAHDKILIANKTLFETIPLESLRQIITLNNPAAAANQITKLLRKAKIKSVNLFIINLLSKEELANSPLKEELENVFYLDKSSESFLVKAKSFWQTVLAPIGKVIGIGIGKVFTKIKTFKKSRPKKKKIENLPINDTLPKENQDKFQKEFIDEARDDHLLKDEEINYSPDLYVHYYQEKKNQKENKSKKILAKIVQVIKNFFVWFISLYKDKAKRKYFYIIIAALAILIIGLVIGLRGKGNNNLGNLESQKILSEAIAAQKDAKNNLTIGNNQDAKTKYAEAIEKAQSIQTVPLVAKDAEAVITTSYQELDKLTSTTRFTNLEPIITIPDNGKGFYIASGEAFIVTETDIYKSTLLGGKPQKTASFPKNKGNYLSGASLGTSLYFYTSNQNIFEFNPSTEKLNQTEIADDARWETANAIASYVGSLYLLDGVIGQIYKHPSNADVFDKGEEYLAGSNNLKQSLSLAVDGSIYVLKNDGQVSKFQRSKLQDFSLKNIPSPYDKITEPRKIYTDSDTPSLYILDTGEKRILEFDKEGSFIRQYVYPDNLNKVSDFFVSVKSKKIWLLNEKSVYEINI